MGHWSTDDLEVNIKNNDDFEKDKKLIDRAYEIN